MENQIQIKANGRTIKITNGLNLEQLLDRLGESRHPDQVVEVNHCYVDARNYGAIVLRPQDRVEVLRISFWGLKP